MERTTQQLIDIGVINRDLAPYLMKECPYDGAPIIRNDELTSARCMHPECRGHMMYRADDLFKYLGVKGIGPKSCLAMIKTKDARTHFDLVPVIFGEIKPRLHLWEIAMFCYIPGIQTGWENILAGYVSFTAFFEGNESYAYLKPFRKRLEYAEKFFNVKPPLAKRKIEVMITGSINGYGNRNLFIDACNSVVGGLVRVKSVGAKQSADYLICENKTNVLKNREVGIEGTGKIEAAINGGVKVVTSVEFLEDLHLLVKEILGIKE